MIIKKDKAGNELASWPTVEEAAKAIKVSPKVLRGHIQKGKPPKLGGFVFKELIGNIDLLPPAKPYNSALDKVTPGYVEKAEKLVFQQHLKNKTTGEVTPLKDTIVYVTPSPEVYDGPKLPVYVLDEMGHLPTPDISLIKDYFRPKYSVDEFGDPVELKPEEVEALLGHESLRAELYADLVDYNMAITHTDAEGNTCRVHPLSEEAATINPDWLLTPLQRRLKDIGK